MDELLHPRCRSAALKSVGIVSHRRQQRADGVFARPRCPRVRPHGLKSEHAAVGQVDQHRIHRAVFRNMHLNPEMVKGHELSPFPPVIVHEPFLDQVAVPVGKGIEHDEGLGVLGREFAAEPGPDEIDRPGRRLRFRHGRRCFRLQLLVGRKRRKPVQPDEADKSEGCGQDEPPRIFRNPHKVLLCDASY